MSHSKGPWRVGRKVGRTIYSSETTEGSLIGVMDRIEDARLAAAAPELLHLLGLIVAEFKSDPMSVQCFDLDVIVEPAKALVKKLEGKS